MINEKIRELREKKGLNQVVLADYLNVRRNTYSDYETGKINIPIDTLIKIADFHNVSLDYIAGRTNNPKPYPKD